MADDKSGNSGSELQSSQAGGGSGDFGGNMNQSKASGRQQGGGPGESDLSQAGGSSGTGGYGSSQNVVNHQGQGSSQPGLAGGDSGHAHGQSRGTRFDEEQGGGRGVEDLDREETAGAGPSEFAVDQAAHQDRGQGQAEQDFEREES